MSRGPSLDTVPTPTVRKIHRLRKEGVSPAEIGRQIGMQAERVRRICDHFGIERWTYKQERASGPRARAAAKRAADIRSYWLSTDKSLRSA